MKARLKGKSTRMGEFFEFWQGCYRYTSGEMNHALIQLKSGIGTLRDALNIHLKPKSIYTVDSRVFEMNFELRALNTKIKSLSKQFQNCFKELNKEMIKIGGKMKESELS